MVHAAEYLKRPSDPPPIVVLAGAQHFFKQQVIEHLRQVVVGEEETSFTQFSGRELELKTLYAEVATRSMWGDRRLVVLDEADEFIKRYRAELEPYFERPVKRTVLVINAATWVKTTRLAKLVATSGLELDCSELKGAALMKWLLNEAQESYQATLTRDAAELLVDLVGSDLGLLNQELDKLSTAVGASGTITVAEVKALVGGWRAETVWAMGDAVRDGRLGEALRDLDQLLVAGEPLLKLLGGLGVSFKKFAWATELARTMPLDAALKEAGVFPAAIGPTLAYLRRIGRPRAEQILRRILELDSGLKGGSPIPDRAQFEKLLIALGSANS